MSRRKRVMKLTPSLLRKIVLEEKRKMLETVGDDPVADGDDRAEDVEAAENDADELAQTLAKDLDHMKALKIQEQRLMRRLRRIKEAKTRIRKRVSRKLD